MRPSSPMAVNTWAGNTSFSHHSPACGAISLVAKSWHSCRNACCSSVSERSTSVPSDVDEHLQLRAPILDQHVEGTGDRTLQGHDRGDERIGDQPAARQ